MKNKKRVCAYTIDNGIAVIERFGYQTEDGKLFIGQDAEQEANAYQTNLNRINKREKVERFLIKLCKIVLPWLYKKS